MKQKLQPEKKQQKDSCSEQEINEKIEQIKKIAQEQHEKSKELKKEPKKEEKDTKEEKIEELTETLQRLQAEFENYKKRCDKEKAEFIDYANYTTLQKMLPILDSFELAINNKDKQEDFIKGVELIFAQLYQTLENEGVRSIKSIGEKFDPYKHEVLLHGESEKEEGIVLEELQKGYMLKGKVLRFSKVKVSKKNTPTS